MADDRLCATCDFTKPLDGFGKSKSKCLDCQRAYARSLHARLKLRDDHVIPTEKRCSACKEIKPPSEFGKRSSRKDGLDGRCKSCSSAGVMRSYRKTGSHIRWKAANPEKVRANSRREHARDAQRRIARSTKWLQDHPERRREYDARRRARKLNADGQLVRVDFEAVWRRDEGRCYLCNDPIESLADNHFDHVVPLSRGGAHSPFNIAATHRKCNWRKGSRLLSELDWAVTQSWSPSDLLG